LSQYFFAFLLNSISLSFFFLSVSFSIRTQTVCRNWHTSTESKFGQAPKSIWRFKQFKKSYSNCDFFYLISLPQFFVSFSNLRNIFYYLPIFISLIVSQIFNYFFYQIWDQMCSLGKIYSWKNCKKLILFKWNNWKRKIPLTFCESNDKKQIRCQRKTIWGKVIGTLW